MSRPVLHKPGRPTVKPGAYAFKQDMSRNGSRDVTIVVRGVYFHLYFEPELPRKLLVVWLRLCRYPGPPLWPANLPPNEVDVRMCCILKC